jgi:hypothetical protein
MINEGETSTQAEARTESLRHTAAIFLNEHLENQLATCSSIDHKHGPSSNGTLTLTSDRCG